MGKVVFGPEVQAFQVPDLGQSIIDQNSLKELRGTFAAMSMKAVLLNNIWIDSTLSTAISRWVPFSHVMFCDPAVERIASKKVAVGEAVSLMVSEWIYSKIMADVRQEWAREKAKDYDGEKAAVTAREIREAVSAARLGRGYARERESLNKKRELGEQDRREIEMLQMQQQAEINLQLTDKDAFDWTVRRYGAPTNMNSRPKQNAKEPVIDFVSTPKRKFNLDDE